MKSLEILENETIANIFLDTAEEFIKDITKGLKINKETKEDIQIICNIISEFGSRVADKIQKSLFPIKQDLEVLEIIYKKEVDIGYIKDLVKRFRDNDYILERYNATWDIVNHLTMEELLKLKQWLEEHENE